MKALFGFAFALTASLILGCAKDPWEDRPDSKLISQFFKHRNQIDSLSILFNEDSKNKPIGIRLTKSSYDSQLPSSRIKEYRKLLNRIESYSIQGDTNVTEIIVVREGMLNSGFAKGFAKLRRPAHSTSDTLSHNACSDKFIKRTCYKLIENEWYLFLREN